MNSRLSLLRRSDLLAAAMRANFCIVLLAIAPQLHAQIAVTANPDHAQMLHSTTPTLAAHKRLVYDFWREVLEGGHLELAEKYLTETYIQHNPSVPTGRAGFVEFFKKFSKPKLIADRINAEVVAIVAEGDFVVLSLVQKKTDPKDITKTYTTTWFDMFRIENGRIAEHWDSATKQ